MLVLSRKSGQSILLPELGIRIMVVSLRAGSVKIGIEADRRYTVLRGELAEAEAGNADKVDAVSHVDTTVASAGGVS